MKDYTKTLTKILGKEKYQELEDFTYSNVKNKFGNIKYKETSKIAQVNKQALLIIAIQKARGLSDIEILKTLHWNSKKSYKFIVASNLNDFIALYNEYINLIIEFIK